MTLERMIEELKHAIAVYPKPVLILAARYLMNEFDRSLLPDWVEILANGNPDDMAGVMEVVRDELFAESVQ
jgi:hypothetical protein